MIKLETTNLKNERITDIWAHKGKGMLKRQTKFNIKKIKKPKKQSTTPVCLPHSFIAISQTGMTLLIRV